MNTFIYDVTVVIPVYNTEKFVEECVNSLIIQKMDFSKIEILLINDGSSDNSAKICEKLADKYKNIFYVYKENSGVSDTRNVGINMARGKYIMLLDSDDYLGKNTIKNLVSFFDKHYNEVDLVTYPIYWDRNGKISLHNRYSKKKYDKGTGIYFLDEYPYLNQSTVNIIFKNEFENNLLYDTSMKLSEDQNFNTSLLMRKNKIGFVKSGEYFYRRHGSGVSQTRNNPYYCFNDIMTYNESLLEKFQTNGKVPKYVQTLIVNTFEWRVKTDELLPYHYEDKEFDDAKKRISNILKRIDNDVILEYSNCDDLVKLYFMNLKEEELEYDVSNEGYSIMTSSNDIVSQDSKIECYLYRIKNINGRISIFASFSSPILEIFPITEYEIDGKNTDGTLFKQVKQVEKSNVPFRNSKMMTAHTFPFTFDFNPSELEEFQFSLLIDGHRIYTKPVFIMYNGFTKKFRRYSISLDSYRLKLYGKEREKFSISKDNWFEILRQEIISIPFYPLKRMPRILQYRYIAHKKKDVWLYSDSPGVIDNAYYQFVHDFNKNDGIERYYIVDGDTQFLNDKLTPEQKKYIVKYKSKKHKILFLQAKKLLISFSSLSIYSPFKNLSWYMDLLKYELVYLQHGILHASLQRMYAKEFTQIDKFVISSHFEKDNLINNYDYNINNLIISGMPRMTNNKKDIEVKDKILFAPSWRQYLIGQLINNRRVLKEKEFLSSDFFNEINDFLHSSELKNLLEDSHLKLEFKLHPIFKEYRHLFNVDQLENVDINFDKTVLDEYKIFITDFSSYQFDYIKLKRPIVYFLPDKKEFKAGLHSYKDLDLKYENAFGKLCLKSTELIDELTHIIESQFMVDEPYKSRMENFFTISDNPSETIYQTLMKGK